ncbi:MAG: FAD/NAD(P)-binding protein [Acidobacteriota bacterium]
MTPSQALVPRPMEIASRRSETADTFTLTFDRPISFAPGQFNMLYLFGVGEVAISISGDPHRPLSHTVRAVGSVTRRMARLRRGDVLGVRGPFGNPWPMDAARGGDLLVIAGGLGLAPLRPAILHALAHRKDYARVAIVYGARTPADVLYARDLARWRKRSDLGVFVTVDRAGGDWTGHAGVITALIPTIAVDAARATALLCGPEVMMRFAARELEKRGMRHDRIHVSLERNMKCAVGFCGHCQLGPAFVCKDGPVFRYDRIATALSVREL